MIDEVSALEELERRRMYGKPPARQPQRELLWEPHWITPPDLYQKLDAEFHFDYDPCPFPKPEEYNGLNVEWGKSNYVNPPFHRENGIGPTAFVRKAIEENKKGKTVVITIPTQSYVNLLLEAGAEVRSLGRVRWLHTVTREPMKGPSPITAFILRATHTSAPAPALPEESEQWREVYQNGYTDGQAKAAIENERIIAAIRAEAAKAERERAQQRIDAAIEQLSDINKYAREEYEEANLSDNEREMRIHLEYGNRVWGVVRFLRAQPEPQQEGRR